MTKDMKKIKSKNFENITEEELNLLPFYDKLEYYIGSFNNIIYAFDVDKNLIYAELYDNFENFGFDMCSIIFVHKKLTNSKKGYITFTSECYNSIGQLIDRDNSKFKENIIVDNINMYDFIKNKLIEIIYSSKKIKKKEIDINTAKNNIIWNMFKKVNYK